MQIGKMLILQDSINKKVNPDWKNAENDWLLAVMVEGVEAIEHHGWKWWKHQQPDTEQLQMELIDIWHFALSFSLTNYVQMPVKEMSDAIVRQKKRVF